MEMIGKLLRKLAGVDEALILKCPRHDQIFATHVGFALFLAFCIIFISTYHALSYIGATEIIPNPDTGGLELISHSSKFTNIVIISIISLIVALSLLWFDRAVFQSDWFYQSTYGISARKWTFVGWFSSLLQTISKNIGRVLRIIIRLAISLFVSINLAIFLNLHLHEASIMTEMQEVHLVKNMKSYEKLATDINALDIAISDAKNEYDKLKNEKNPYTNNVVFLSQEEKRAYEVKITEITDNYNDIVQLIYNGKNSALTSIDKIIENKNEKLSELSQKLLVISCLILKEEDPKREDCAGIQGSGIPGAFQHFRKQKRDFEIFQSDKTVVQNTLEDLRSQRADLARPFDIRLVAAKQNYELALQREKSVFDAKLVSIKTHTNTEPELQKHWQASQEKRVETAQKVWLTLLENKQSDIIKLGETLSKTPTFIQFRDGPIERMSILTGLFFKEHEKAVERDEWWNHPLLYFTLLIIFFISFLEMLPILEKFFFFPPSVYSARLRSITIRQNLVLSNKLERAIVRRAKHKIDREETLVVWKREQQEEILKQKTQAFKARQKYQQQQRDIKEARAIDMKKKKVTRKLVLAIRKRNHYAELTNQKAKLYRAKQELRRRNHEAKADANIAIQNKISVMEDNDIENRKKRQNKIMDLQSKIRDKIFSVWSTKNVEDGLN